MFNFENSKTISKQIVESFNFSKTITLNLLQLFLYYYTEMIYEKEMWDNEHSISYFFHQGINCFLRVYERNNKGWCRVSRFVRVLCVFLFQNIKVIGMHDQELKKYLQSNVDINVVNRYKAIQPLFMSFKNRDDFKGKTDNSVIDFLILLSQKNYQSDNIFDDFVNHVKSRWGSKLISSLDDIFIGCLLLKCHPKYDYIKNESNPRYSSCVWNNPIHKNSIGLIDTYYYQYTSQIFKEWHLQPQVFVDFDNNNNNNLKNKSNNKMDCLKLRVELLLGLNNFILEKRKLLEKKKRNFKEEEEEESESVDVKPAVKPAVVNPSVVNPLVVNPLVVNLSVVNPTVVNPSVVNPSIEPVVKSAVVNPSVVNPTVEPAVEPVVKPAVVNPADDCDSDIIITKKSFKKYKLNIIRDDD